MNSYISTIALNIDLVNLCHVFADTNNVIPPLHQA